MENIAQEPKFLFVLGPAGCSRLLINQVVRQPRSLSDASRLWNSPIHQFNNQNFSFIHAPGVSDCITLQKVLVELDRHLASDKPRDLPSRLTGIIFIYPKEAPDDSILGPILQTLGAFIGAGYAERVTLYLSPGTESRHGADTKTILDSSSAIRSFYRDTPNPKIISSSLNQHTIDRILGSYAELGPCRTYVQDKTALGEWVDDDVLEHLRHHVHGVVPIEKLSSRPGQTSAGIQERAWTDFNKLGAEGQIKPCVPNNDTWAQVQPATPTRKDETQEAAHKEQIQKLTQKLEQTQAECAYLRSHVHPPDSVDEPQIVNMLDNINRLIEEVAQAVSKHLIDKYAQGGALADEVSLRRLSNMGRTEGRSSLVASSNGVLPDLSNHFPSAIQALLCSQLYERLFKPFHPSLADNELENAFITDLYNQIAYREPQSVAGRWRKDAFNSISSHSTIGGRPSVKSALQSIVEALDNLFGDGFSTTANVILTEEHWAMLDRIITAAEGLNQLVKGGIVFLGDYRPIAYSQMGEFRSAYMLEPGNTSKAYSPDAAGVSITVELGLIKQCALGESQEPEETILRRAAVMSGAR